eukprot:TRINITY_DN66060_c0_g1_i1.p1 TRINITY_DN66060_c0_g1~~TRINITY_DN66060_c0_g1_i1.p1  ORF type:complete len:566 (+),score=91.65 TRINITY_DN66060_c0_g1_i1:196-1698(+)
MAWSESSGSRSAGSKAKAAPGVRNSRGYQGTGISAVAPPASPALQPGRSGSGSLHRSQKASQEVQKLNLKDFQVLDLIDTTPMSSVHRLRNRRTGSLCAGKRLEKGSEVHRSGDYLNEVKMLQKLAGAPYVVSLHGVVDAAEEFWTMLELCTGGRMEPWLRRFPKTAKTVAQQLLEAVRHLHAIGVCHLDLKPDNVLLTESGQVRICDFVTGCELEAGAQSGQQVTGKCGTDGFRAPEVSRSSGYCPLKADVFSLGRTLQVLLHSVPDWKEMKLASEAMTASDPQQRPSIATVVQNLYGGSANGNISSRSGGDAPSVRQFEQGSTGLMPRLDAAYWASLESVSAAEAAATAMKPPELKPSRSQREGVAMKAARSSAPSAAHAAASERDRASASAVAAAMGGTFSAETSGRNSGNPLVVSKSLGELKVGHSHMRAGSGYAPRKPSGVPPPSSIPRPMACGSVLCSRLGACLCNDNPCREVARLRPADRPGAKIGLRRSNTP